MMIHSVIGALPHDNLITSDEKVDTLIKGFQQLNACLSKNSFYGRGENSPTLIMTDNCVELHEALLHAWPNVTILLCKFHILQQVWKWLNEKNMVPAANCQNLLYLFKQMIYANAEYLFKELFNDFMTDDLVSEYPNSKECAINSCGIK